MQPASYSEGCSCFVNYWTLYLVPFITLVVSKINATALVQAMFTERRLQSSKQTGSITNVDYGHVKKSGANLPKLIIKHTNQNDA